MNSTHLALLALALAGSFIYIYNIEANNNAESIIHVPNALGGFQFTLQPNNPQTLSNQSSSYSTVVCTAYMSGPPVTIFGAVTSGSGTWNGIPVGPGGFSDAIANGLECQIGLSSGGIVRLTNQGSVPCTIQCN